MLLNYLKIALRNLARQKGYACINIAGLAIGLAACILILLYLVDELSYDTYHEYAGRIYRLTQEQLDEAGIPTSHATMIDPPIAPLLKSELPEVEKAARITPVGPMFSYEGRHLIPDNTYWADPDLLEILSIPLIAGDATRALVEPFSLLLSRNQAETFFGAEDPIGKTVLVNGNDPFTVRGVFENQPANTHLPIDVLGSFSTLEAWFGPPGWESPNYVTYVRLLEGSSPADLEGKLTALLERHRPEAARLHRLHLQKIEDIHLRSNLVGELGANGDIRYVYLLSVVALFILVIACVNFINLSTARASRRTREVGIRKVLGATRRKLAYQFLGESTLLVLSSITIALILVQTALPFFNDFTGKTLGILDNGIGTYLLLVAGVGLTAAVAAGGYPALFLSSFRPAAVLKSGGSNAPGGASFRSVLVMLQFIIAIVLVNGTLIVFRQLDFIRGRDLGFDEQQVLVLPVIWDLKENFDGVREQLLQHSDVMTVAQSQSIPSRRLFNSGEFTIADVRTGVKKTSALFPVSVDAHFFAAYRIEFAAGRGFREDEPVKGVILNETAASRLGWPDVSMALGATMRLDGYEREVVGVVRDFHFESLHQQIAPMIFFELPWNFRTVSIRIRPGADLAPLFKFLESKWQQYVPNRPVRIEFLDRKFGAVYVQERKLGRIFAFFSALAIFITCMGLFGMAAYSVERRTKEVGIRKALGATAPQVVSLFARDFLKLVTGAIVVATPIAFVLAGQWLDNFAYRAELSWWLFALAAVMTLAVAAVTVGYQSARAAMLDPVKTLRYE